MYKIYINETPLYLANPKEAKPLGPASKNVLVLNYPGKKKFLLNVIDQLEKSNRFDRAVVFSADFEKLWADFLDAFQFIEAAGGAVFNQNKEVLAIFRREYWDLPKGKIDKGESPEQAAVREVMEETGLSQIDLGPHLHDTWHTYQFKNKRVLKRTYWYLMHTSQTALTPQADEDIESAQWMPLSELTENTPGQIYGNILDVLEAAQANLNHG